MKKTNIIIITSIIFSFAVAGFVWLGFLSGAGQNAESNIADKEFGFIPAAEAIQYCQNYSWAEDDPQPIGYPKSAWSGTSPSRAKIKASYQ